MTVSMKIMKNQPERVGSLDSVPTDSALKVASSSRQLCRKLISLIRVSVSSSRVCLKHCYKSKEKIRDVLDEKIWGVLKAKHYIFVGLVVFQPSGWLCLL